MRDVAQSPVRQIGFVGDDARLAAALVRGDPSAPAALFDRYGGHVQGVLANLMGVDAELPDMIHEVFARALRSIASLRDGAALKAWLTTIAVHTARGWIRARSRRRWLRPATSPDYFDSVASPTDETRVYESREAIRATYRVLDKLSADLRTAFALRFISGQELTDVAASCGVSLATIKRRLSKAEKRFRLLARGEPALARWVV